MEKVLEMRNGNGAVTGHVVAPAPRFSPYFGTSFGSGSISTYLNKNVKQIIT